MRKRFTIGVLALGLAVGTLAGCGNSVEMRLQRAKIALGSGKPDQALEMADSVLKEKPDNTEAMLFKARAQLLLARLADGRKTIEQLTQAHPDMVEAHELMTDWTFTRLSALVRQSGFAVDAKNLTDFDEATKLGQAQTDWLEKNGKDKSAAHFLRARYAEIDSMRLGKLLEIEEAKLTKANLETDPANAKIADARVKQLRAQLNTQLDASLGELDQVTPQSPRYFDAMGMKSSLLIRRQKWSDLWALAQQVGGQKDIPVSVFVRLTLAIMQMPGEEHALTEKVAVGEKLRDAVAAADRDQADWKITSARLMILAKDNAKAEALLDEVLKKTPTDAAARFLKAHALYDQGKFDKAKMILAKLATERRTHEPTQLLYGMTLWKLGDDGGARDRLRQAINLDPSDPQPRAALIEILAENNRLPDAEPEVEENYQKNPANPQAIRLKMQFHQAQAQRPAVKDLMSRVEKLSPLTEDHLRILIDGYTYLQQYDQAETFAEELVKLKPDQLDSHLRLVDARMLQGKEEQVKKMLTELQTRFPQAPGVNQTLAKYYLQRKGFDRAKELLQAVIDRQPANAEAWLLLAQANASLSLMNDAIEDANKVLELVPDDVRAHTLLARVYKFMGQPDKVNENLNKIDPNKVDEQTSPTLLAQLKIRTGAVDEAAAICNRAIASGNSDPMLRLLLADYYSKKKDFTNAEDNLVALIRVNPNNEQAWILLARFYVEQNQVDHGLKQMMTLQGLADSSVESLARLSQASLLAMAKRPDEAYQQLQPILEPLIRKRDKGAMQIADAMAKVQVAKGDGAAAYAVYEPFKTADFMAPQAMLRQIDLTIRTDKPEQVVPKLDAVAAKLTPEQAALRYEIMNRYANLGRFDRALTLLDEWIAAHPDNATLLRWKAEVFVKIGKPLEAVGVLRAALKIAPESPELYRRMAEAHIFAFDYPSAEKDLRDLSKIDSGTRISGLSALGQMFVELGLTHQALIVFDELEKTSQASDPRVIYAIGRSFATLGNDDKAAQRLSEIPSYAAQYASAQILIARIEQRGGKVAQAKMRLEKLANDPSTASAASQELMHLDIGKAQTQELMAWSDQALKVEKLPENVRKAWMRVRVAMAANRADWKGVLEALSPLIQLEPNSAQLAGLKAAVLTRLKRLDEAAQALPATAKLMTSPLLALSMGQLPIASSAPLAGLPAYTAAMIRGDIPAARSAIEQVASMRTVYRTDLASLLDRPDATSQEMADAFRVFGLAQVAYETGLPQLTEELCGEVIRRIPSFAPAYGLLAQAQLDLGKPVDKVWTSVRQAIPTSSFALFITAHQKMTDKDYTGAAADMENLLKREPQNSHVRYDLSQVYQLDKQMDKAVAILQKLSTEPGLYRIAAANDLAYVLAENYPQRRDEALTIAQAAIKENPNFAALQDTMGWIEHLRGKDAEALVHLNQAIQSLAALPEVQYHLGLAYKGVGNGVWSGYYLNEAAAAPDKTTASKAKATLEAK